MFTFSLKDPNFLPHVGCDVEICIGNGQTIFLTGENGLGKSSLLKKMSETITNSNLIGQIPLDVFYDRQLEKYKAVVLKGLSGRIDPEIFSRIWDGFGLSSKENRLLSQLSGGERQCVKLATGLALSSELLLLDEPSQYLDEAKKKILFLRLKELNQNGKSLLIVEHDLSWWKESSAVIPLIVRESTIQRGESWTIS
jgi:ABC-type Mn2+/Zn2+ transport system ATPase subunit